MKEKCFTKRHKHPEKFKFKLRNTTKLKHWKFIIATREINPSHHWNKLFISYDNRISETCDSHIASWRHEAIGTLSGCWKFQDRLYRMLWNCSNSLAMLRRDQVEVHIKQLIFSENTKKPYIKLDPFGNFLWKSLKKHKHQPGDG